MPVWRVLLSTATMINFIFLSACGNEEQPMRYTTGNLADTLHTSQGIEKTSRGMSIFQERCKMCHGVYGDAQKENAANLRISRIDSLSIAQTIINGRGRMPMFDHAMPDSDLAQVVMYVKSLRTP